jgi:hypothetical protein
MKRIFSAFVVMMFAASMAFAIDANDPSSPSSTSKEIKKDAQVVKKEGMKASKVVKKEAQAAKKEAMGAAKTATPAAK